MQYTFTRAVLCVLICAAHAGSQNVAALGTMTVTGGATCETFQISSGMPPIDNAGNRQTVSIKGNIKNASGKTITHLTVRLEAGNAAGTMPPSLGWIEVNGEHQMVLADGHIPSVILDLGKHDLAQGATGGISIGLDWDGVPTSSRCGDFKIYIEASIPAAIESTHADACAPMGFLSTARTSTITTGLHRNPAISTWIKNLQSPDVVNPPKLTSLTGSYTFPAGHVNAITGVHLLQGDKDSTPVPKLNISFTGDTLSLSGFSLSAGGKFRLVITFKNTLVAPTTLELTAGFSQ